jgi:hypothetical protein
MRSGGGKVGEWGAAAMYLKKIDLNFWFQNSKHSEYTGSEFDERIVGREKRIGRGGCMRVRVDWGKKRSSSSFR